MVANCDLAPLVPFVPSTDVPWDAAAAQHLYQRLAYRLSPEDLAFVLSQNPRNHVLSKLREASALAPLAEPPWSEFVLSDYTNQNDIGVQRNEWAVTWLNDMRDQPWRSKMVLFWHNHFATEIEKYQCPSWMWQYHDVLQRFAFGDFRELVKAVGKSPAMLVYLDGVRSTRFDPNENYARELFELFTLGEGNGYTQTDIVQAARALTGYNRYSEPCAPITFVPGLADSGLKTVFGIQGNFTFDQLHDLIFTERAVECSTYICTKLYQHFVSPDVDTDVVDSMAATLRNADWNLLSVYELLFASSHFFSPALQGARIKDPFEFILGTETLLDSDALRTTDLSAAVLFFAADLGQQLFNPPDVAGWPGDRAWVNATTLSQRYDAAENVVYVVFIANRLHLVTWARSLNLLDESDVSEVARAVTDFVLPKGLPNTTDYTSATDALKSEVPDYYFEAGIWNLDYEYAPEQLVSLLIYLLRRPEYQLC